MIKLENHVRIHVLLAKRSMEEIMLKVFKVLLYVFVLLNILGLIYWIGTMIK
ncbi:hypothetical protein [Salipaludibacillus sp. CF4.18]|uniref:hypothetical protein n=1 Tax=Salipaludibacillus sp. CF4.18 TaxID=3373081 RepID=UPI003EE44FA6